MLVSTRVTVELPLTSSRHIIRNRILKHKRARVPLLREDDLDVFMITGLLPTIAPYSWAFLSFPFPPIGKKTCVDKANTQR